MNRLEKEDRVRQLTEAISSGKGVYLADFTGLDVEKVSILRRQMREAGIHVQIAKNTLLRIAMKGGDYDALLPHLNGPNAILVPTEEEVGPAKILSEFIRVHKLPKVKLACLDGRIYDEGEVQQLAKLPPREILLGMFLRVLQGPLAGFVGVVRAPLRDLANVLDQVAKTKGA